MKVLIADRSYDIRQRLKNLVLTIFEYPKIFETDSNMEAMSIAEIHKPDLVITDIDLYNGSGLRLLSLLNSLDVPSIKIVFTNHFQYDLEHQSKILGADYFLSKAHDFIQIKHILNNRTDNSNNYLS